MMRATGPATGRTISTLATIIPIARTLSVCRGSGGVGKEVGREGGRSEVCLCVCVVKHSEVC